MKTVPSKCYVVNERTAHCCLWVGQPESTSLSWVKGMASNWARAVFKLQAPLGFSATAFYPTDANSPVVRLTCWRFSCSKVISVFLGFYCSKFLESLEVFLFHLGFCHHCHLWVEHLVPNQDSPSLTLCNHHRSLHCLLLDPPSLGVSTDM